MDIKSIGLSTSAFGYAMGNTGKKTDRRNPEPWQLQYFAKFSARHGLGGIEAPLARFVPDLQIDQIKSLKELLSGHDLFFLMDAESALDAEEILKLMPLAKEFGSSIIRIKSSNVLGCDRNALGRPWTEHVERCISVIGGIASQLRDNGLRVAVENHQDLDSNDLMQIVNEVGADVVGVNYDIGNAFSVCEDPILFAEKLGPAIINVHLKDYKIYRHNDGFWLARSPLGGGAVDFKKVLPLLAKTAPSAKMVIELGALEARNVAWLKPAFWQEIKPRQSAELVPFFQLLERDGLKAIDESWRTPWEKKASPAEIVSYEVGELETSINYLSNI